MQNEIQAFKLTSQGVAVKPKNFINYHLIRALSSDGASEPIRDVYTIIKELKMISAQHSSNNGKNWVTKKSS